MFKGACTDRKTGEQHLTDREVAEYVAFIVTWAMDLRKEKYAGEITKHEENIKVLSKDKKANQAAIDKAKESIETMKKNIAHCDETISIVSAPDFEVIDDLLKNYNEKDVNAKRIFDYVVKTYYPNTDKDAVEPAEYKNNVQQRAGIILNLFRDVTTPNMLYNEANLTEMPDVKEEGEQGAAAAEEPKKE